MNNIFNNTPSSIDKQFYSNCTMLTSTGESHSVICSIKEFWQNYNMDLKGNIKSLRKSC